MFEIGIFLLSFLLYSLLRVLDTESTRKALAELNPELHEMNPLVPTLINRIGFNKTMYITWFLFAIPIGVFDTLVVYPIIGFPTTCILFGMFHVLAFGNNMQIYFQTKIIGARTIEEGTKQLMRTLKGLPTIKKIAFLIKMNFFNLFLTIYGLLALILFLILLSNLTISLKGPVLYLLLIVPPVMIVDLILFFPTIVFGSLLISWRRLKLLTDEDFHSNENRKYLTVSVDFLEEALNEAQATGAEYVQFSIPSDE